MRRFTRTPAIAALLVAWSLIVGLSAPVATAATPGNGSVSVSGTPWPPAPDAPVVLTGTAVWHNIPGKTAYQCSRWTITFDGTTFTGGPAGERTTTTSSKFSHTFIAPNDAATRANRATATCTVQNTLAYGLININPVLSSAALTSKGTSITPVLPPTGGPSIWWLVVGLALVACGGGVVVRQRR